MTYSTESFDCLIGLTSIQSGSKTHEGARHVLVNGMTINDAAKVVGVKQPTLHTAIKRINAVNDVISQIAKDEITFQEAAMLLVSFRKGSAGALAANEYIKGTARPDIARKHGIARNVVRQACDRIDENEQRIIALLKSRPLEHGK